MKWWSITNTIFRLKHIDVQLVSDAVLHLYMSWYTMTVSNTWYLHPGREKLSSMPAGGAAPAAAAAPVAAAAADKKGKLNILHV